MLSKRLFATIGRGISLLVLSLLLLFAFMSANATGTQGVYVRNARVALSKSFAIADFDGDHRSDLANIYSAQSRAATTDYFIQLQLSATGRRSLHLEGPPGGLVIESRDVNGDNAPDLVLMASLHGQPVAIFINDGHGSFSQAKPAEFPGAFHQFGRNWDSASRQQTKAADAPPQSRAGIGWKTKQLSVCPKHAGPFLCSPSQVSVSPFLTSHAGRAPPFAVPQS